MKAMDDAKKSMLISRVNSTLAGLKSIDHHHMFKAAEAEGKGKFVDMALGPLEAFFVGLDGMIGLPKAKVLETMRQEHNSPETFKAHNQGMSIETSPVVEWERVLPDINGPLSNKDFYGAVMCDDFMQHKLTKAAGLTKPEVLALRLYTGPLYVKYNTKLRDLLKRFYELQEQDQMSQDEAMIKARQESGDRFVTTIHAIASALIKLAKVSPLPPGGKVYRGLSGMNVPDCFRRPDKYGCRGGVEFGFMSTSMSKEQAMVYMDADEGMPTLFEVRTGQVDRGARLNWVSQFPREEEVLLPPLCNLEVEGDARYEMTPMGMVMVWPLRLNVNLKGLTVEELQERRKTLHVAMFDNLISEIQLDFHVVDCAESYKEAVLNQCREVLHKHKERPSQEYNEDSTYKDALEEALNIKSLAPRKMAIICQRRAFDCDEKDFRRILHAPLADIGQDGKYYKLLSGFSDFPWEAIFERAAATRVVDIPASMNPHQISLALECVCKNLESVEIVKYGTAVMRDLRHLKFGESNAIELCNLGATFGTDGAKFAASLLAARSSITSLRLSGSTLGRPGGSLLAPAIRMAASLTLLDLSNTSAIFGPLGASELFVAMKATTNLNSLSLSNNHLGLLGVRALAEAIRKSSHALVSLDLSNCSIGSKAEEVLCSALATMHKLQAIKLVGNVVMHKGCLKLAKTLAGIHSLTSINGLRLAQGATSWYDVRLARLPVADVFLVEALVQLNTQLTSLNGLAPPAGGGVWDVASQLDGWWANVSVVVPFLKRQLSHFPAGKLQVKLANRVVLSSNAAELLAAISEEGRVRAKKAAQEKYKTEQLTTAHMLGAARQGHAEGVMLLKAAGLETAAEEWRACLHFAAEEGQQEVAKAIMAVGGEELVRITDGESKTCLHMAASKGHTKFAAAVLAVGGAALAKMQDKDGWTCLHLAAYSGYLDFAEAVLAVGGTDLVKIQSKDGWTCLHLALQREHKELSELFILVGGEELVKIQDKDGKTCLHYAAYRGRKDVVEAVMEGGATELVKIQDKDGKTCLHYAAYRGRKDVADAFLLVGGADLVKIQDKDGKTCLHLAFVIGGLGVNWNQYKDFAEAVVAVGGEDLVKIKDKEGKSCLEWAEEKGRSDLREMIERVLARTASSRANAGGSQLRRAASGRGAAIREPLLSMRERESVLGPDQLDRTRSAATFSGGALGAAGELGPKGHWFAGPPARSSSQGPAATAQAPLNQSPNRTPR